MLSGNNKLIHKQKQNVGLQDKTFVINIFYPQTRGVFPIHLIFYLCNKHYLTVEW